MEDTIVKQCLDCEDILPITYFHYSDKPNGRRKSYCKDCSYIRAQAHFEKDPIAYRSYMKRYYKENPEKYPGNHYNQKIPATCGVYIVDCLLTDDSYIGCSANLRNRRYRHSRNIGAGKNKPLSKLINELGWEAFDFRVLEECDPSVKFERETHYIQIYNPSLNTYKVK